MLKMGGGRDGAQAACRWRGQGAKANFTSDDGHLCWPEQMSQAQAAKDHSAAVSHQGVRVEALQLEVAQLRESNAEKSLMIASQRDSLAVVSAQVDDLTQLCHTLARQIAAAQQDRTPATQVGDC